MMPQAPVERPQVPRAVLPPKEMPGRLRVVDILRRSALLYARHWFPLAAVAALGFAPAALLNRHFLYQRGEQVGEEYCGGSIGAASGPGLAAG